jgi:hypothetical protein
MSSMKNLPPGRLCLALAVVLALGVAMLGCGGTESATTTAAPSSPNLSGPSEARAAAKAAAAKARGEERASEKARERRELQHDRVVAEEKAKHEAEDVSPACKTDRQMMREEEGPNPPGEGAYLREDQELVQEECGVAGRRRWARVKNESPRESQCKVARMLLNEAIADDIPSYIREGEAMVAASCGE